MSAWSSAAGKPQLSYAERLRNAGKPPASSAPRSTGTPAKNEPAPSKIVNANISQQRSPASSSRAGPSSTSPVTGETSRVVDPAAESLSANELKQTGMVASNEQAKAATESGKDGADSKRPAAPPAPAVNIWEARKKQLAEKEAEKERLRQQQIAAQKKANAAAAAFGSTGKQTKQAASASTSSSQDPTSSKAAKQPKASAAASSSAAGQKSKQDWVSKSAGGSGSATLNKKRQQQQQQQPSKASDLSSTAATDKAQTASKASSPQQQSGAVQPPQPHAIASSSLMSPSEAKAQSTKAIKAAGSSEVPRGGGHSTANVDEPSRGPETAIEDYAEVKDHALPVPASADEQAAPSTSIAADSPLSDGMETKATVTTMYSKAKERDAFVPVQEQEAIATAEAGLLPAGSSASAAPTSDLAASTSAASRVVAGPEAAAAAAASVEDAIERALQSNAAEPQKAEDDDAWLARIHLLNGGQNMPKYGDFGPGGKGYGIAGSLQDEAAMSEAERLAAKKAERAVAAAWGVGKNVWQKGQQQRLAQQSTAPTLAPTPAAFNMAPSQQPGPSRASFFSPVEAGGSAIRLVDPNTIATGQDHNDAATGGKKKRRASNPSRFRGPFVHGLHPDVATMSKAASSFLAGDNSGWSAHSDAGKRDVQRGTDSNVVAAAAAAAEPSRKADMPSTSSPTAQKGQSSEAHGAGPSTGKKGKQSASGASNAAQPANHSQGSGKKGQAGKALQGKQEANKGNSNSNQALQPQQQKKGQQASSSKASKAAQAAVGSSDGPLSSDVLYKHTSRSQSGSGAGQDLGRGTAKGGEAGAAARTNKAASRRINGLVSESSGLSSGQNSVAGSPRARPSHLPATPPPPASFPPRNDSSVAQPMSISASAQHFAQSALGIPSSPLSSARAAPQTAQDGSHSPSRSIDAGRGSVAAGPVNGSTGTAAMQDSWRAGASSTPKRGRDGTVRGAGRGGGRGGSRGGAPETFSPHSAMSVGRSERRAFGSSAAAGDPAESPLANRQYPRSNAQQSYPTYSGFVPAYPGDATTHDPALVSADKAAAAAYGSMPMYAAPPPGQGYFGQVQTPMPTQWTRYYANAPQPQDVFGDQAAGVAVEMTSQTGVHVPARTTQQLLTQIEFYFSQRNLLGDFFLRQCMDSQGWVDIATVASFKRVQQVTTNTNMVKDTLLYSAVLDVDVERMKVRKRYGWEAFVLPEDWKAPEVTGHAMHVSGSNAGSATAGAGSAEHVHYLSAQQGGGHHRQQQQHQHQHQGHGGGGGAAHVDATSATPSKVSTAMSSPPSSFTRSSQDEREGAEGDVVPAALTTAPTMDGAIAKPYSSDQGREARLSAAEDDYMNLGVVAASGLGGTLSSLSRKDGLASSSSTAS